MQIKRLRPLLHDKAMLPCVCRNGCVGLVSLIDSFGEQLSQVFMLRVFDIDTIC